MVLVRKRNYKKIAVYSVILVIVIILGGYMVYNSMSENGGSKVIDVSSEHNRPIISDYEKDFLEKEDYKNLIEFGKNKLPLDLENIRTKRNNPFNPI
ncbi:MAG: hypothetical protein U5L76_00195 [Patescibacteria group bacterium]|nr:hypothetical protein [Patescibacteria group bacterium]